MSWNAGSTGRRRPGCSIKLPTKKITPIGETNPIRPTVASSPCQMCSTNHPRRQILPVDIASAPATDSSGKPTLPSKESVEWLRILLATDVRSLHGGNAAAVVFRLNPVQDRPPSRLVHCGLAIAD